VKRVLFALAGLAMALTPALAWDDVLPQSSEVYLTAAELAGLDCDQLWHARNEIRNPKLNPFEQKNIALIQKTEAAAYCSD
jgi:hypothetical protein